MSTADAFIGSERAGARGTATIADHYRSVLDCLPPALRRRYVLRLTHGFCEGWRPSRGELTDEIAVDLGLITVVEARERRRRRRLGHQVRDLLPRVRERMGCGLRWPATDAGPRPRPDVEPPVTINPPTSWK